PANRELCCHLCGSTDFSGTDADGYYVCSSCGNRWLYKDNAIDVVDENGAVVSTLDMDSGYTPAGSSGSSSGGSYGGSGSGSGSGSSGGSYSGGSNSSGGSGSSGSSGNSGGSASNNKQSTATSSKSAQERLAALKKMAEALDKSIEFTYDDNGNITVKSVNGKDTGLFGFKYNTTDKVFITAEDAWQRNFGFEKTYDDVSGLGAISYDTARIKFDYDGLEWMVQLWKGQYGYFFEGAEIGVYHRESNSTASTMYQCATDTNKYSMEMTVYRRESSTSNKYTELFHRSRSRTWWLTGFTPGSLQAGAYVVDQQHTAALRVDATIYFKNSEIASAFVEGLKKVDMIEHNSPARKRAFTFTEVGWDEFDSSNVNGRYALKDDGVTVRFSWR
ncbi:MAG: DUF4474 domain-containing protein, partial [Clostridia bacterium]|nr:DUF4474 domain-containing protein [Clostridia bacterium]